MTRIQTRICQNCGQSFQGGNRARYCPACKIVTCSVCGNRFSVRPHRVGTALYCSRECAAKVVSVRNIKTAYTKTGRKYGRNHPNWRGGTITPHGYRVISVKGKRVYEHRYRMEQHLGRPLKKFERVHHINGNKLDNRIENLAFLYSESAHRKVETSNCGYTCVCQICRKSFKADQPSYRYCGNCQP